MDTKEVWDRGAGYLLACQLPHIAAIVGQANAKVQRQDGPSDYDIETLYEARQLADELGQLLATLLETEEDEA